MAFCGYMLSCLYCLLFLLSFLGLVRLVRLVRVFRGVCSCGLAGRFGRSCSVLGIRGVSVPLSWCSAWSPLRGCRVIAHCELPSVRVIGGLLFAWCSSLRLAALRRCVGLFVPVSSCG